MSSREEGKKDSFTEEEEVEEVVRTEGLVVNSGTEREDSASAAQAKAEKPREALPHVLQPPAGGTESEDAGGAHVNILVRLKPQLKRLPSAYMKHSISSSDKQKLLSISCPSTVEGSTEEALHRYEFSNVTDPTEGDAEFCDKLVPSVVHMLGTGSNVCIMCYGQTGSGKTHSVNALIPCVANAVFGNVDADNDIIELSYLQIYKNKAYNLLGKAGKDGLGSLLPEPNGSTVCEPKYLVQTSSELLDKFKSAQRLRCTSSHTLNARSSQSHTILSLHVSKCVEGTPLITTRVTVVDLAGSELMSREGEEVTSISQSLSTLDELIRAVTNTDGSSAATPAMAAAAVTSPTAAEGTDALPSSRENLLALYLAPRIREWHLILVVTASLEKANAVETKSSLEFATRVKNCVLPKVCADTTERLSLNAASFEDACGEFQGATEALRTRLSTTASELEVKRKQLSLCAASEKKNKKGKDGAEESQPNAEVKRLEPEIALLEERYKLFERVLAERALVTETINRQSDRVRDEYERKRASRDHYESLLARLYDDAVSREDNEDDARDAVYAATGDKQGTDQRLRTECVGALMWVGQQLDEERESNLVQKKALASVRADNRRLQQELVKLQKEALAQRMEQENLHSLLVVAREEHAAVQANLLRAQQRLCVQHVENAIREESLLLYNEEKEVEMPDQTEIQKAYDEQRTFCDALQSRLNAMELELDRGEKQRNELDAELKNRTLSFKSLWTLLSPQQKARFTAGTPETTHFSSSSNGSSPNNSGGIGGGSRRSMSRGGGDTSLQTGHENVQLRFRIKDLNKQLQDAKERCRESSLFAKELREENDSLRSRLQASEERFRCLKTEEEYFCAWREQLEVQLADSLTFLESYELRQHVVEQQLRDLRAEVERLTTERDTALAEFAAASASYNSQLYCRQQEMNARGGDEACPKFNTIVPLNAEREASEAPRDRRRTSMLLPQPQPPQRLPHRTVLSNMLDISERLDRLKSAHTGVNRRTHKATRSSRRHVSHRKK